MYVKPGKDGKFRWQASGEGIVPTLTNEGFVALVALDEEQNPTALRIVRNTDLQRCLCDDFVFWVKAKPEKRSIDGTNRQIEFYGQETPDNKGFEYARKLPDDLEFH
ncbi:hypothetical protein MB02_00760 [Croceicoccus estronivorus]|nr:hypothetical protein MB02_00760 [Croceicoccus estronivorus]